MSSGGVVPPRIVVGVDLQPGGRAALAWAEALAGRTGAEIIAVHASGLLESVDTGLLPAASARAQIAASLDGEWCEPVRRSGIACRSQVRDGSPVDVLQRAVEAERARLLVVARRRDAGAAAQAIGSTSLHVLEQARSPTLIVPAVEASGRRRPGVSETWRVVVGIDGSGPALRALGIATDLVALFDGEMLAAAAVEETPVFPLGPATADTSEGEEEAPTRASAMLADACRPARARGLRVRTACRRGAAPDVLLDLADAEDADLVVVGARGLGAPGDPLLGSVSRQVVHEADRPILVVPATAPGRLFAPAPAS